MTFGLVPRLLIALTIIGVPLTSINGLGNLKPLVRKREPSPAIGINMFICNETTVKNRLELTSEESHF